MRSHAFILATIVVLAAAAPTFADPYAPKVGQMHPEFTLADIQSGKPVSLSDFRGKKVLLIHFASW